MAGVYEAPRRWPGDPAEFSAHEASARHGFIAPLRAHLGEPGGGYEASSCGEVWYRSRPERGVACPVLAPGSRPRCTGDRIQTDRRDAKRWAE